MKTILLILVVAFGTITAPGAEKPKHVDPLTGHPIRTYKGKTVDFTKGIASVQKLIAVRFRHSTDPLVMAEYRKRVQEAERDVRPWAPMLVDGRLVESNGGLIFVKGFKTQQIVAVTNAPSSFGKNYVVLAFPAGRVRYGSTSIPLFDYGQPVAGRDP